MNKYKVTLNAEILLDVCVTAETEDQANEIALSNYLRCIKETKNISYGEPSIFVPAKKVGS